jgi:hypothetical protein
VKIGEAIELRVMSCMKSSETTEGNVTSIFGYDCESEDSLSAITWGCSVNGVLGSNDEVGLIRDAAGRVHEQAACKLEPHARGAVRHFDSAPLSVTGAHGPPNACCNEFFLSSA